MGHATLGAGHPVDEDESPGHVDLPDVLGEVEDVDGGGHDATISTSMVAGVAVTSVTPISAISWWPWSWRRTVPLGIVTFASHRLPSSSRTHTYGSRAPARSRRVVKPLSMLAVGTHTVLTTQERVNRTPPRSVGHPASW